MNKKMNTIKRYKSLEEFQITFLPNHYDKNINDVKSKFKDSGTGLALEMINDIKNKLTNL